MCKTTIKLYPAETLVAGSFRGECVGIQHARLRDLPFFMKTVAISIDLFPGDYTQYNIILSARATGSVDETFAFRNSMMIIIIIIFSDTEDFVGYNIKWVYE